MERDLMDAGISSLVQSIRDPWLREQGTPLLALAQLYQVFKAQHGAYARSIPGVESSRDLGVGQVLEMLPALRAGSHPSILRLHPHLGDQVEL